MIPQNKESVISQIKHITEISQSDIAKKRAYKLKYRNRELKTGICSLCKTSKEIYNEKYGICIRCHKWCRNYLHKKFGYVDIRDFLKAIENFVEPISCQFYAHCGNVTSRLAENGRIRDNNRPWVCDTCRPMWEAGFLSGRHHLRGTIRKGRTINNDFNR